MKNFYLKTAVINLKKNSRLYIPKIIAGAVMFGVLYIMLALNFDESLENGRGARYIPMFMVLGSLVMFIITLVLMFYSNGFLMKQRKKEYGLYNVLGLEKKHVIFIMFFENLISDLIQAIFGFILGISFYKLCALLISNILKNEEISGHAAVSPVSLMSTLGLFFFISLLTFTYNSISIKRLNPSELLKSSSAGEKEPRVKWVVFILGLLTLGGGYVIAITIESPLKAIALFFVAVILVIIGTYCLFGAGSIFILKRLKSNKKFYYRPEHMISVSGLIYRMKQNAAGLASIAILATGVLIMISSTVSLYSGIDRSLDQQYMQDLYFTVYDFSRDPEGPKEKVGKEKAEKVLRKAAQELNIKVLSFGEKTSFESVIEVNGEEIKFAHIISSNLFSDSLKDEESLKGITFMDYKSYNSITGTDYMLNDNEGVLLPVSDDDWKPDFINMADLHLNIQNSQDKAKIRSEVSVLLDCYLLLVSRENLDILYQAQVDAGNEFGMYSSMETEFAVCLDGRREDLQQLRNRFAALFDEEKLDPDGYSSFSFDSRWDAEENYYGINGSLLFLGILLSIVCLIATSLIIYYKQISEGYEDRDKFQIMQKVGLSGTEVKRTIRSQILMVFFLPLIVAGIHILFAYPIISKMMLMLSNYGAELLLPTMGVVYAVFAVVYIVIFKVTAGTYYKIVR